MKIAEENKIKTANIKAKMFRGYHQVIKNMKKNRKIERIKNMELNLPNLIFLLKSKEKSKKEYLPFELDYNSSYKDKYKNKLDDIKADDLQIINLTKQQKNNKLYSTKENMFLTQTKSKNVGSNTNNDNIDKENKEYIFKKLFPDKDEIYKYSELPFFSLTKNPHNFGYRGNNMINLKENDDIFSPDDFLFKLSHKQESNEKYIKNNFNKNKGVKRGIALTLANNNNKSNLDKKKIKLMLDVENLNNNKQIYLSSKEKRFKILEKEIEPLKNVISIFKDFETEIANYDVNIDSNNNIDNNKLEKKTQSESNINTIKAKKENKNLIINGNNFEEIASRTAYNPHPFKKPRFYPVNYYSSNQILVKEKRYEDKHRIGVEEFQRKINLKATKDNSIKNIYKKKYIMDEYEKQWFKKLIKKEKLSLKDGYLRNCRINDIILVSKLKCEFSPKDVKRVLNGIKPWDDCKKLDQKFYDKNLPSKVKDVKTIKFEFKVKK